MYALIGLIARGICFANPTEPAMFLADECHRMTRAEEGVDIVIDFLREGRKEQAYIGLGSQDPDEGLGNETLRGLIPTRFAMRPDRCHARSPVSFIRRSGSQRSRHVQRTHRTDVPRFGQRPGHRRGIRRASSPRGGLHARRYGNIGRIKVLMPSEPNRAHATQTTPDKAPKELIEA